MLSKEEAHEYLEDNNILIIKPSFINEMINSIEALNTMKSLTIKYNFPNILLDLRALKENLSIGSSVETINKFDSLQLPKSLKIASLRENAVYENKMLSNMAFSKRYIYNIFLNYNEAIKWLSK